MTSFSPYINFLGLLPVKLLVGLNLENVFMFQYLNLRVKNWFFFGNSVFKSLYKSVVNNLKTS